MELKWCQFHNVQLKRKNVLMYIENTNRMPWYQRMRLMASLPRLMILIVNVLSICRQRFILGKDLKCFWYICFVFDRYKKNHWTIRSPKRGHIVAYHGRTFWNDDVKYTPEWLKHLQRYYKHNISFVLQKSKLRKRRVFVPEGRQILNLNLKSIWHLPCDISCFLHQPWMGKTL